jgi:hypothetical protein
MQRALCNPNRATGWNLARKLKLRLQKRADGELPSAAVDVVVGLCRLNQVDP